MIHVIIATPSKKTFRFGRGHDSDVRISDISVSRCHAIIKYINGQFYLEDNLSKFGTLVLVRSALELETNFTKAVQIGRTVISFNAKNLSASGEKVPSAGLQEGILEDFTCPKKKSHGNQHIAHDPSNNPNAQLGANLIRNAGEPFALNQMQNMMGAGNIFFLQGNQFGVLQNPIVPPNIAFPQQPLPQLLPPQDFFYNQRAMNYGVNPVAMEIEERSDNEEDFEEEEDEIRNTK